MFPCLQVSLVSSSSDQSDGFPLDDLFEECSKFFDFDVDNDFLYGEAGRNFVVATVFPSREECLFCFASPQLSRVTNSEHCSLGYLARFKRTASSSLGILHVFWDTLQ